MLCTEADAFSKDVIGIGRIDELQMNINLVDNRQVRKNYLRIPSPLYHE